MIDASDEWTPELDIKYYFNEKWAIELVLANPEHDVEVEGAGKIGTVKLLPPTISVQYHCLTDGKFQPYLGAGVNITTFSTDLPEGVDVSSTSLGPAIGAGINWFLNDNWLINADVKYAMISGDLEIDGQKISTIDIDPLLVGVGVGYRF